jgi:hypothetical protein
MVKVPSVPGAGNQHVINDYPNRLREVARELGLTRVNAKKGD